MNFGLRALKIFLMVAFVLSICTAARGAFPTVQARSTATVNGTALLVTLPTGSVSGDLIVIMLQAHTTTTTWTQTAGTTGWTELYDTNGQALYYKQIGGGEANPSFTSSASEYSGASALRITGHMDPAVQPPVASTVATGTSTTPNPPLLTPAGGARDYLWIAVDGNIDGRRTVSTAPTNYTNLNAFASGGGPVGTTGATAERQVNSASEDPGTFTLSGSSPWIANTVAIYPLVPRSRRMFTTE